MTALRVLHVGAECQPWLKTGGLADVLGALPAAQRAIGVDARLLLPGFPAICRHLLSPAVVCRLPAEFGVSGAMLVQSQLPNGTPVYVIDAPALFDRPGNPYADANHHPYADNHLRFALLGRVAAELACGLSPDWRPDLLHGHDWHSGLAPVYLRYRSDAGRRPPCVFTVHNLAYQGLFSAAAFAELDLPPHCFDINGVEFHGQMSFIKAGLFYSERLLTVSPSYAVEIQSPEHGCGLDGLLAGRRAVLGGILNGVDEAQWDPAHDALIAAPFAADRPAGKARCKLALQAELGLAQTAAPLLFGVVSRLTEQKGLNLVLAGAEALLEAGGQLAVLGNGDVALEAGFSALARRHPGSVAVVLGFDEALSHRLFAGMDVALVPSRFEPCGLTQLYAMRYGALPLVRRTGGLADTVCDANLENLADGSACGFVFERFAQTDFDAAVRRAFALRARQDGWQAAQQRAMRLRFGWQGPAAQYVQLYQQLAGQ
ncbi:glycogen synthase GlgA [Chitinimonas sp.]|uniref:glycogen synthase GlgA n=1 Tax=Chitinimonas sp. TaxID=1934313 RepID=UPI0035AEB590